MNEIQRLLRSIFLLSLANSDFETTSKFDGVFHSNLLDGNHLLMAFPCALSGSAGAM